MCNINGSLPNHVVILYQRTEKIQKDANELAAILSRKNKCKYRVLIDLSCVAVIRDPFDGCISAGNNPEIGEAFGMEEE